MWNRVPRSGEWHFEWQLRTVPDGPGFLVMQAVDQNAERFLFREEVRGNRISRFRAEVMSARGEALGAAPGRREAQAPGRVALLSLRQEWAQVIEPGSRPAGRLAL